VATDLFVSDYFNEYYNEYFGPIPGPPPSPSAGTGTLPIVVEAVMTLSWFNGGGSPNNLAIVPRRILWDNAGAAGHAVLIVDGNGTVLFKATATAQFDSKYAILTGGRGSLHNRGGARWKDFQVTQLDSGQLYIWYTN